MIYMVENEKNMYGYGTEYFLDDIQWCHMDG